MEQTKKELSDEIVKEIVDALARIEDDIENEDLALRESKHIAELARREKDDTRARIRSMRRLELLERRKAARSRQRFLYCVLVYFLEIDHLKALALCSIQDSQQEEYEAQRLGVAG